MLEGYSSQARRVVSRAEAEARRLQHERVGTEHLLLGLLCEPDGAGAEMLHGAGATLEAARHKVAEIVGTTGAVPDGTIPLTQRAQRALDRGTRFAHRERLAVVEVEHVLRGVLDVEGLACQVLRGLGVDVAHLRDELAGGSVAVSTGEPPQEPSVSLRCPACHAPVDDPMPGRLMDVDVSGDPAGRVLVVHCATCGAVLGVVPPPSVDD